LIQESGQGALFLMFNAGTNGTDFGLPPLPQGFRWHVAVDTSRLAPQDLFAAGEEALVDNSKTYRLEARSSTILLARKQESVSGGGSV
jgi:isoamylase